MVKKTIVAIAVIVLLVVVFVGADRWVTRYGPVYYYGEPYFMYYPYEYHPYSGIYYSPYSYPEYNYPYSPLSTSYMYRYGTTTNYPLGPKRSSEGQLCGLVDSQQFGCEIGLVCDYTKTNQKGVGICTTQSTYPYYG